MAKSPEAKAAELRTWMRNLTSYEEKALALVRPFNVHEMQPTLLKIAKPEHKALWNYFRVVISSSGQGVHARSQFRGHDWLVLDKTSGAFLGLVCFDDLNHIWKGLTTWVGAPVLDRPPDSRQSSLVLLKRCLPGFEFGDVTGGKMLALMATSRDVVEMSELQYSRPITTILVKTLKGRSSQYNRLRGFEFVRNAHEEKGYYAVQTREGMRPYLTGQADDPGPLLTPTAAEQLEHWRTRWLPNRLETWTDKGWVRPDRDRYRLTACLVEKLTLRLENEHE